MGKLWVAISLVVTAATLTAIVAAILLSYACILDGSATTGSLAGFTWFLAVIGGFAAAFTWMGTINQLEK